MASSSQITQTLRKSLAMGPSVRNLLSHYRLDPKQIASTGPHKILLKSDVLDYISQKNLTPQAAKSHSSAIQQSSIRPAATMVSSSAQTRLVVNEVSKSATKYRRRSLDPLEIEVINSGGLLEKTTDTKPKK